MLSILTSPCTCVSVTHFHSVMRMLESMQFFRRNETKYQHLLCCSQSFFFLHCCCVCVCVCACVCVRILDCRRSLVPVLRWCDVSLTSLTSVRGKSLHQGSSVVYTKGHPSYTISGYQS